MWAIVPERTSCAACWMFWFSGNWACKVWPVWVICCWAAFNACVSISDVNTGPVDPAKTFIGGIMAVGWPFADWISGTMDCGKPSGGRGGLVSGREGGVGDACGDGGSTLSSSTRPTLWISNRIVWIISWCRITLTFKDAMNKAIDRLNSDLSYATRAYHSLNRVVRRIDLLCIVLDAFHTFFPITLR